jgi:hypothetical protein
LTPGIFFSSGVSASLFVFSTTSLGEGLQLLLGHLHAGAADFSVSFASRMRFMLVVELVRVITSARRAACRSSRRRRRRRRCAFLRAAAFEEALTLFFSVGQPLSAATYSSIVAGSAGIARAPR